MNMSTCLITNPKEYRGRWNELFNNNNPIYVEIGMGKGKFIIENALKYPNINFIGIEKFDSVIARALQKVESNIPNLYMIRIDALEIDEIFDREIDKIYLNFSDPWPKKRHELRRLTSLVFLKKYDNIFKGDSIIEMRTDNRCLFTFSLISLNNYGYLFEELSLDLHSDNLPLITTEYEDKFSDKGLPIYYVRGVRKNVK